MRQKKDLHSFDTHSLQSKYNAGPSFSGQYLAIVSPLSSIILQNLSFADIFTEIEETHIQTKKNGMELNSIPTHHSLFKISCNCLASINIARLSLI